MAVEYVEAEGFVHMIHPNMGEYTLCGDAFDLGSDVDGYEWQATKQRSVTCPECTRIIAGCRGARVRQAA